jgi:hypothetical protein
MGFEYRCALFRVWFAPLDEVAGEHMAIRQPPVTSKIRPQLNQEHNPMTRRNVRNHRCFQLESLEDRNAPSHFGVHATVAHAVTHTLHTARHQEVQSVDRNSSSSNDSSTDRSNDSSADTNSGSSVDTSKDPSKDVSSRS